jgi:uncharacterized membrane protein
MLYVNNISYGLVGMIDDDKHTPIGTRVVLVRIFNPKKTPILNTFIES